jgi:hypothetical protein
MEEHLSALLPLARQGYLGVAPDAVHLPSSLVSLI